MYQRSYSIKGFEFGYSKSAIPHNDYHIHDSCEVFYMIDGSGEYFIKDKLFSVYPGCTLFIPPNTIHRNRYISESYERIVINFTPEYIEPDISDSCKSLFENRIFFPQNSAFIRTIFSELRREWDKLRNGDLLAKSIIKSNINVLLSHFIRCESNSFIKEAAVGNPSIERLVQCINTNYHMPITLSFAAEMLHMSPSYLSVLFQESTGFGFKEYIISVRIKNACLKLQNTDKQIRDIAYSCGFNDSNYFSSMFKKIIGISPMQYRKNLSTK